MAGQRPTVVPYVTAWSGELPELERELVVRSDGRGIAWRTERPEDRDAHGVLWGRLTGEREGLPLFGKVHPARQREVMAHLGCQVCSEPASRTAKGVLFLMTRPSSDEVVADWPEEQIVSEAPVCLPCARTAVEQCWALRGGGAVAVRVRKPRLYGVFGSAYLPDRSGRLVTLVADLVQPCGDPSNFWVLASQLLRELRRCTVVDLAAELEQFEAAHPDAAPPVVLAVPTSTVNAATG